MTALLIQAAQLQKNIAKNIQNCFLTMNKKTKGWELPEILD